MKCIKFLNTSNKTEEYIYKRVSDIIAEKLVNEKNWKYCSKQEWKKSIKEKLELEKKEQEKLTVENSKSETKTVEKKKKPQGRQRQKKLGNN